MFLKSLPNLPNPEVKKNASLVGLQMVCECQTEIANFVTQSGRSIATVEKPC